MGYYWSIFIFLAIVVFSSFLMQLTGTPITETRLLVITIVAGVYAIIYAIYDR